MEHTQFGGWLVVDDFGNRVAGPFDTKEEAVVEHDRLIACGRDSEDTWVDQL